MLQGNGEIIWAMSYFSEGKRRRAMGIHAGAGGGRRDQADTTEEGRSRSELL